MRPPAGSSMPCNRPLLFTPGAATALCTHSRLHSSAHSVVQAQSCTGVTAHAAPCNVVLGTGPHEDATRTALHGSGCRHRRARSRLLYRAVQLQLTSRLRTVVPETTRRRATPTVRDHHSSMQAPLPCAAPCPPQNCDSPCAVQGHVPH